MESTLALAIFIIIALLILVLIFKILGLGLKIITNPKVLLAALLICIAALVIVKMTQ